ncbi:bestrophin family ion channel, partial [Escherichia coli]
MIVRPTHNWFRLLFTWNGSVLLSIMPQLCFMAVI